MSNSSLPVATEQFGVIRGRFSFENKPLTIVTIKDEPWFIVKEVAVLLGNKNPSQMADDAQLDKDEIIKLERDSSTGNIHQILPVGSSSLLIVSESGLYGILQASRLEKAKPFKRWIRKEVLPSIRKTGKYELQPAQSKDIAETSRIDRSLIELRDDISYLMDETSTLKRQMDIVAFTGNRAGPTPGARPQICMDYARRKILSGCLDKLLIHKDAKRRIYLLVLNELTDVFPQYRNYTDSELIHPTYIDKFIKERVKVIDSFFSDSLD